MSEIVRRKQGNEHAGAEYEGEVDKTKLLTRKVANPIIYLTFSVAFYL